MDIDLAGSLVSKVWEDVVSPTCCMSGIGWGGYRSSSLNLFGSLWLIRWVHGCRSIIVKCESSVFSCSMGYITLWKYGKCSCNIHLHKKLGHIQFWDWGGRHKARCHRLCCCLWNLADGACHASPLSTHPNFFCLFQCTKKTFFNLWTGPLMLGERSVLQEVRPHEQKYSANEVLDSLVWLGAVSFTSSCCSE